MLLRVAKYMAPPITTAPSSNKVVLSFFMAYENFVLGVVLVIGALKVLVGTVPAGVFIGGMVVSGLLGVVPAGSTTTTSSFLELSNQRAASPAIIKRVLLLMVLTVRPVARR